MGYLTLVKLANNHQEGDHLPKFEVANHEVLSIAIAGILYGGTELP